jgi:hypothetical protein
MKLIHIGVMLGAKENTEDSRYSDVHDDCFNLIQRDDTDSETAEVNETEESVECAVDDAEIGSYFL